MCGINGKIVVPGMIMGYFGPKVYQRFFAILSSVDGGGGGERVAPLFL